MRRCLCRWFLLVSPEGAMVFIVVFQWGIRRRYVGVYVGVYVGTFFGFQQRPRRLSSEIFQCISMRGVLKNTEDDL